MLGSFGGLGMYRWLPRSIVSFFVLTFAFAAQANINLDLRPDSQTVLTGSTVELSLFAVSDNAQNQSISAMDVILVWDPSKLQLTGFSNSGNGYNWLNSGFLYPGGLNATYSDGDAIWTSFAQLGNPAYATPTGLLVTKFQFQALVASPPTPVAIPRSRGGYTTVVYDGSQSNQDVTGTLDSGALVRIVDETVEPSQFTLIRGQVASGGLSDLFQSDDQYLALRSFIVLNNFEEPVRMVLDGTSPIDTLSQLKFVIESAASLQNIGQRIELYNFSTGRYELFDAHAISTVDAVTTITVSANASNYVESGTGALRARVGYKAVGPIFTSSWLIDIDQTIWKIAP